MLNKKAEYENLIKILLWIAFFAIAIFSIYFLIRRFTG